MDAGTIAAPPAVQNTIKLSPEVFPEGITPKAGDTLVLGEPDAEGMLTATYQPAKEQKGDGTGQEEWEQDFKKHMSAVEPQESAA